MNCAVIGRAAKANWVALQRTTRFAVAATNHSALGYRENEVGRDEMSDVNAYHIYPSVAERALIVKFHGGSFLVASS